MNELSPETLRCLARGRALFNQGAHWEKVKLARAASPDYKDKNAGYRYALEYDNNRKEYASLKAKNGGKVTVLDRKATRPQKATNVPFPK